MSLSEQYETNTKRHKKIQEEHDNLLIRTVSVTDDILKEQLREEYLNTAEQLAESEIGLNFLETQIKTEMLNESIIDFKEFYERQFKIVDLITCISTLNKIDMVSIASKNRLRIPATLKQQRELAMFANTLNYKFIILDYEGFTIDEIGKGTNPLYIHSLCFSRFAEPISHIVGIPKAMLIVDL